MNYSDYKAVKDLESLAESHGFRISNFRSQYDSIALMPKGEYKDLNATLPCFSRDAEFGVGTVEGNLAYLRGWARCMDYMRAMGLVTDKKIADKTVKLNEYWKRQEEIREQEKLLKVLKNG